jgi:microcystin-dependent protein
MAEPYIGEIRIFGFNFAPYQWAFCNGQLMQISQNAALFSIIGTTYGGDGQSTFALPNFQDRAAMHWGNGTGLTPRTIGQQLGTPTVTLTSSTMPAHNHMIQVAQYGNASQATGTPSSTTWLGQSNPGKAYSVGTPLDSQFSPKAIGQSGGSAPHQNLQPLLTMNFCIALYGIFPTRG